MAEYTPSPQAVEAFKAAWHEADAEGDEGNRVSRGLAAALAQHDAELRAEVERLRATEGVCYHQNAQYLAMKAERDEARQQVADLRAGIEALADTKPGATGRALRALLAGSGEQPGEADRAAVRPSGQEGS